ncbi:MULTISPECIES: helix-turn-helix transcriptional regulator [unclassified Mesotoga]|uniref:ArsR/SmtB family transcription factor n=1 Tax=unclassified Mesotoga TaxID=1184398 RepID=UPI00217D878C|nr:MULTISPECIES: winged helix-turn-helix domain-containing protein [unclassified Mesotoga]MDD4207228.1 winged helix-turn-helix domain-containing protein [Mesotoga sp.]MDD5684100.1 winged helix-turn-helix domain-containing protein [Mesotoga sp.]
MYSLKIIPGYVELVEILMACGFADRKSYFNAVSHDLGLDFEPGRELGEFLDRVNSSENWSIRMAVDVFSEIKDSVIFFCDFPDEPGREIPLEDSIESLANNFEDRASCVVASIMLNNLNLSQEDANKTLQGDLSIVSEAVEKAEDLSENTTWFITQLIKFPRQSKEILLFALGELKKYYDQSGLRKRNRDKVVERLKIFKAEEYEEVAEDFLEFYGIKAREDLPLHLLFQNTLKYSGLKFSSVCNIQLIVFSEHFKQIGEIMNPVITDNTLRLFLRNLSDQTKMQILKAISEDSKYVDELAKLVGLSKATISYHLSTLAELALVTSRKDHRRVYFSLNKERLEKILRRLEMLYDEGES